MKRAYTRLASPEGNIAPRGRSNRSFSFLTRLTDPRGHSVHSESEVVGSRSGRFSLASSAEAIAPVESNKKRLTEGRGRRPRISRAEDRANRRRAKGKRTGYKVSECRFDRSNRSRAAAASSLRVVRSKRLARASSKFPPSGRLSQGIAMRAWREAVVHVDVNAVVRRNSMN